MRRRGAGEGSDGGGEEASWMRISISDPDYPEDEKKRRQPLIKSKPFYRSRPCQCCLGFLLLLLLALVAVARLLPASPIQAHVYSLPPPPEWSGPLAPNRRLAKAERVLEGELVGPESIFLMPGGETIFTGLADGRLVKLSRGILEEVARFGSRADDGCDGSYATEAECGRPLGIRMDEANRIIVADAYAGLVELSFANHSLEERRVLLPAGAVVEGVPVRMINDVLIYGDEIIFSDSSTRWSRRDLLHILMEAAPDGRVMALDRGTGAVRVLMRGLRFPNGLEMARDGQSFLVAETLLARVHRYQLAGPQMGESSLWAENLPGFPDNIRRARAGGFWVPFATIRHPQRQSFIDRLQGWPSIRGLVSRLVAPRHYPWLQSMFSPKYGLILRLSDEGQVEESLHDPDGLVLRGGISEVADAGHLLYLGSYHAPFLAKLRYQPEPSA